MVVVDHHIPPPQLLLRGKISLFNKSLWHFFFSVHLVRVLIQVPHPVDPGKTRSLISLNSSVFHFASHFVYSNNALDQDQEVDQNVVHHR